MAIVERSLTYINNNLLGRNTWYQWAPKSVTERWEWADHYSALASDDKDYWRDRAEGIGGSTPTYLTVPLANRIARTSANMLFGENPTISLEDEADNQRLAEIVKLNSLHSKLKRAAEGSSIVGGIYGLSYIDTRTPRGKKTSLIRFIPERRAVPTFANDDELVAVTFVTEFAEDKMGASSEVWRLLERHEMDENGGIIINELYQGTRTDKGKQVDLSALAQTTGLVPQLRTGLDELDAVYIPNHLSSHSNYGVSDLYGIEDMLLAINETLTVAQDDIRAGAATIFARRDLLNESGNLAEGTRVIPVELEEGGDDEKPMLETVQPEVRAESFQNWQNFLIDLTLMASGYAPQSLGRNIEGGAESGTARRLMMHHTLIEMAGKAKLWEDGLQHLLGAARTLDSQAYEGKAATRWNDLQAPISIELADGMPDDIREMATAIRDLRGSGVMSVEEAVRHVMRGRSEEDIQAEIDRLQGEETAVVDRAAQAAAETGPTVENILDNLGF